MNLFIKLYPFHCIALCICILFTYSQRMKYPFLFFCLVLLGMFYFFRIPTIHPPPSDTTIRAPSYGRVKKIRTTASHISIDIVLDLLDVHAQYIPYDGVIRRIQYNPGKFNIILNHTNNDENENNTLFLDTEYGSIEVVQYAGYLTRRILTFYEPDSQMVKGEMYGFITFGSQVSVRLPLDTYVAVNEGDRVYGPDTIIAKW